jgi:hypothetical protein
MLGACTAWTGEAYCSLVRLGFFQRLTNAMAPPTSYHMALSVLIPLPFDIVSTILRFWIRYKRKAWGPDDWAMLINMVSLTGVASEHLLTSTQPFWSVSTIATIAMAWSGVGQFDGSLTEYQYSNSLMVCLSFPFLPIRVSVQKMY